MTKRFVLPEENSYRGFPGASYANALLYNLHHPENISAEGVLKSAKDLGFTEEQVKDIVARAHKEG